MECTSVFTYDGVRQINYKAEEGLILTLREQWMSYVRSIGPYPGTFSGKGIVICAGGVTYFTCAWINISLLRKRGCELPIEVWYNGNELNGEASEALGRLGAVCRNCADYTDGEINKFAIKPFAILHSAFAEVLFLDADNTCTEDPAYLFQEEEYQASGALFWPDFWTTERSNPIWAITGAGEADGFEQESGQLVIDKKRCWQALNLCLYFNLQGEHYHRMLLGDKDTFKFAWACVGAPYHMISTPVGFCGFNDPKEGFCGITMVQHDPGGQILFFHRNWIKWDVTNDDEYLWADIRRFRTTVHRRFVVRELTRGNSSLKFWDIDGDVETVSFSRRFPGFEKECLRLLKELRSTAFYQRFLLYAHLARGRAGSPHAWLGNIVNDHLKIINV